MWLCCGSTTVKESGVETNSDIARPTPEPAPLKRHSNVPVPRKSRKTPIPAALRAAVWNTYIGDKVGKCKCPVCETTDITPFCFQCGHIVAEANGGPTNLDNLRPICAQCNTSSKKRDMREFKRVHFQGHTDPVWREGFISPTDGLDMTIHRARLRFRDLENRKVSLEDLLYMTGMNTEQSRDMSNKYTPLIGTCYTMNQLYDMILEDIYGIETPLIPLMLLERAK